MFAFLGTAVIVYFIVGYLFITIASEAQNDPFTDSESYFMAILFWPIIALVMLFQLCHRFVVKFGRRLGKK